MGRFQLIVVGGGIFNRGFAGLFPTKIGGLRDLGLLALYFLGL